MNKMALVQYKWKTLKWYIITLLFVSLVSGIILILAPERILGVQIGLGAGIEEAPFHRNAVGTLQVYYSLFSWVMAGVLGFLGVKEFGRQDRKEFLQSLPYKKSQIWGIFYGIGFLGILLSYGILMIASVLSYGVHWKAYHETYLLSGAYPLLCNVDSVLGGIWLLFGDLVLCLFVYHLAIFMRMAMNRFIPAMVGFTAVLAFPYFVIDNIGQYTQQQNRHIDLSWLYRLRVKTSLLEQVYLRKDVIYATKYHVASGEIEEVSLPYSSFQVTVILGWLLFNVILVLLAIYLSQKDVAAGKLGKTIWLENIFIVAAGCYVSLCIPLLRVFRVLPVGTVCIFMGVVFLAAELLMIHIYKGKGRYDHYNTFKEGRGFHA